MKITTSTLIRFAGLALVPAGIVFAGIQPIHPPDVVESVTTTAWTIITSLKSAMCVLFLIGITGLYARQAEKAGWLGLAAFLVLGLSWTLQFAFVFAEAFILPPLAAMAPEFVDAVLGISYGHTGNVNLGALPGLYSVVGIAYMLGGLLFGIATFRAGILPRVPAALLAIAATLTPLAGLLPHAEQRYAAIPVALALAWLGYSLWSERRAQSLAETEPAIVGAQLRPAAAK
ncbi:MAG: hypothetical protein JOZ87_04250 [Chloroflexi bacterium]|nr:hypothetical protein [Chloroflexota bacterium]